MRLNQNRKEAFEKLVGLLNQIRCFVEVILVEGARDEESLRNLGYEGNIVHCSRIGVSDFDLVDEISDKYRNILVLTDFDREGIELAQHFHKLFEYKDIKVEDSLRREIGRLTSRIGVYAIESLDNVREKFV